MDHGHSNHQHHSMSPTSMAGHTDNGGSQHHGHGHGSDFMSGHHMFFHLRDTIPVVFQQWHISTTTAMVLSCLGVFCLAIVFEIMKTARNELKFKENSCSGKASTITRDVPSELGTGVQAVDFSTRSSMRRQSTMNCFHLLQSIFHSVQVFVGYILMLVAMTYNVWLFLSVVVGLAVGYFVSAFINKNHRVKPQKSDETTKQPTFQLTTSAIYGNQGLEVES